MLLQEVKILSEADPKLRICRAPNRHGGFMPIRFFSKEGVLYCDDIDYPTRTSVAKFQTSQHTDWIVF